MRVLLDTRYEPAEPEPRARRSLALLIAVAAVVMPWTLGLMFVIEAPAAIFLALVIAVFSAVVVLAAVMADR
jgi:hypothetical protein